MTECHDHYIYNEGYSDAIHDLEKDLKVLFFRVVFEGKHTHSPEVLAVIEKLKPRFMDDIFDT